MVKGTITDVDISKNKVEITIQHFGRETKHIYKLNDLDGAKWFLDSFANDKDIRIKIKDSEPIESAIRTIAKAHQGKARYGETGWEYNPGNINALKKNQIEKIKSADKKLIYSAGQHFRNNNDVCATANIAGVDLKKSLGQLFEGSIHSHKEKLKEASGI